MKSLELKIDFWGKDYNLLSDYIDLARVDKNVVKIPKNEFDIIKKYVGQKITVYESELKEISFKELEDAFFNLPSELLDLQSVKVAFIPCKQLDLYHNLIPYDKLEPDMVSSVFSPIIEPDSTDHNEALMLFASFDDYGFFVRFEYYNSHNNFKTEVLDCYSYHYADGSINFNLA